MRAEAERVVRAGSFGAPTVETRLAFMRYVGQGHEIPVPLPLHPLAEPDIDALRAAFDREYARVYDRPVPGSDVEVLSYAVTVATEPSPASSLLPLPPGAGRGEATPRTQSVRDTATGQVAEWTVRDRSSLPPGAAIPGPAIIAEDETSTLVAPGWTATPDERGYLHLRRIAA